MEKPQPTMQDQQPQSESLAPKETEIPQEVYEHVQRMRVPVDNTGAKCVDGGYHENEAVGEMAIPGGHLGVSMALLHLGFTPPEAFALVDDFVEGNGGRYGWHTDRHDEWSDQQHEHHDGKHMGCGHCKAAIEQAEKYGLKSESVQALLDIVSQTQVGGQRNMELVVLDRNHDERGVLIVTGTEQTVKPWDEERNTQFFIYDQARHQQFLRDLVAHLQEKGREVSYDDLWSASNTETMATLGLLGSSKGKPMYTVNVDGEQAVIEFAGNAPTEA